MRDWAIWSVAFPTLAIAVLFGMSDEARPQQAQSIRNLVESNGGDVTDTAQNFRNSPVQTAIARPNRPSIRSERLALEAGDTLIASLADVGVPYAESLAASKGLEPVADPRTLRAGQELNLQLREESGLGNQVHLERLSFIPETDKRIVLAHNDNESFNAAVTSVEHTRRTKSANGEIVGSLYEAGRSQGVPATILLQAYRMLSYATDFQRDLQAGDRFELGYDVFDDGVAGGLHPGSLQYASLVSKDRTLRVFRYSTNDGYTGFFDAKGRSIATSLMKTPIDGGRLSSSFGKREHPMLGYTRMHEGLDFAAPRGTPILAAGDGVIEKSSRYGSFGKYVRLRHDQTYSTAYAHLSRYAEGLQPGDQVKQGDVIGYVGATGLATGPNLHFEVLADGEPVNPMALDLPPRRILKGDELDRFQRAKADFITTLDFRRDGKEKWYLNSQEVYRAVSNFTSSSIE